jgi:signal transduction histidine kinase
MLAGVVDELRTAHPGRDIRLRAPSIMGTWDRDRLEQVFSNLVSNAIHYGLQTAPVTVDADVAGERARVSVHNDGPPIPDALRVALFDPFRRGERDCHLPQTAGLGLGLYITHELVTAHGGQIEVQSLPETGTTFRVFLPRASTVRP